MCHYVPSYVRLFDLWRITQRSARWRLQLVSARMSKFFTKVVKSTWSCRLCWSVAPSPPSSSISLPVLWARQEGKDLNYISFSHVNDVRPPVSTPDRGCSEQPAAPGLSPLQGGRKYSRLLRRDRHQTQLQPYYKLEKLAHFYMNQRRKGKKERRGGTTVYDWSTL